MTRQHRHRQEVLKFFPTQTIHFTSERLVSIKHIERNLKRFGFRTDRVQLLMLKLDNCSIKYFSESLKYLVRNNCKNSNNIKILNDSKTLDIDHRILKDLSETNLLDQASFDWFFSVEDRYPIATTIRFLKKQRLLTEVYFNKVFHHQHFDDLQTVIGYISMFLERNALLPEEIFDKLLLVKDLRHLSDIFDYATRSDDFRNKHIVELKLIRQAVDYSANLTTETKNACRDIIFSNIVERCTTSFKDSCRTWFKSISSALDQCTNNTQENLVREKRSINGDLNPIIINGNFTAKTTSKLIDNSMNDTGVNVSNHHLTNLSVSTFLLFTSLVSWFAGKKIYVDKVPNYVDLNQTEARHQIEKNLIHAIDKYGDKREKGKFIETSKLLFLKGYTASNNTNKLENTNGSSSSHEFQLS